MSPAIYLIAGNVPGYVLSDCRCLPCSGVSGSAVSISTGPTRGDYCSFSQVKIASLKCASRSTSFVCSASSGSYRRNPDFSRQNKHGFSRSRNNRQNEERDGSDNLEESEMLSSKNGPLLSASGTPKFQATATPGPREKEIVELFRKVQAQLRERAAIKEEKKTEVLKVQNKQNETVDSLLNLLRKHSVQQGKRSSRSGSSRDFILDQPEPNGSFSEEKNTTFLDLNNTVKHEIKESETSSISRPVSNFRRRSPVPQVKYQPKYADEGSVNSVSNTNLNAKRKETSSEPEPEHDPELRLEILPDPEPDPEPIFSNGALFDEISEDETSEIDEGDNDDVEEHNMIEDADLSGMKLPELRALAKSRGMKGFSKLKKRELLELLSGGSI